MSNTRELSQIASLLVVNDETRNIGIGTTTPTSKLHVSGDVIISGVVTSSSFRGDGSQLTGIVSGIGIHSNGVVVGSGATILNFVGTGNTFVVTNNKIDISISGGSQVSVGTASPAAPSSGNLWYNTNLGRTFIYYNDGDSSQWVDAAPFNIVSDSSSAASVSIGTEAPVGPNSGDLWYNADYARIFVYYDNGINSQWVDAAPFNYAVVDVLNISGSGYVLGNLGIGTTNPTSKLHVVGDTLISGVTTSQNGFTSGIGVTNPVKIAVSGNTLTFTVVGVGSTSLRLY